MLKNNNKKNFSQKSLWNSGAHYTLMRIILNKIQYQEWSQFEWAPSLSIGGSNEGICPPDLARLVNHIFLPGRSSCWQGPPWFALQSSRPCTPYSRRDDNLGLRRNKGKSIDMTIQLCAVEFYGSTFKSVSQLTNQLPHN